MKNRETREILSKILAFCLQGDAKAWLEMFVTTYRNAHQQDHQYGAVRATFLTQFTIRSLSEVWKELCKIQQKDGQDVDQIWSTR